MVAESMFTETEHGHDRATSWAPDFTEDALVRHAHRVREPVHIVQERSSGRVGLSPGSEAARNRLCADGRHHVLGTLPPLYPEWLGDRSFCADHAVRFPYVGGEMADSIATTRMVTALAGADLLGCVGAAGGPGTPQAVASAFAMGASYVVTGSVNQVSVEAGLSDEGKSLLGAADVADATMAPASDMFELGVKLQVLCRGTMFAARAQQLYDVYRSYDSREAIPEEVRTRLERNVLRGTLDDMWADTHQYWQNRDPGQLDRAEQDPRHRMALLFRSYLGRSSRWAMTGERDRLTDYQIWCGPAMGAFNRWTKDGFLGRPENRSAVQIALNLLEGAAVVTRGQQLRSHGVPLSAAAFAYRPRRLAGTHPTPLVPPPPGTEPPGIPHVLQTENRHDRTPRTSPVTPPSPSSGPPR